MRAPNRAIQRVRHLMPTVEDVKIELNNAKYFTKLDLREAYHQLVLHPNSSFLTTFSTHKGLFCFKRLNYGTNTAGELFQHALQEKLSGIKGVFNIADDIFIHGRSRAEHDEALRKCLEKLEQINLKVKPEKCMLLQDSIEFYGIVFTRDDIKPDPKKVQAFASTSPPTNVSEVRSLLGMSNYCSNFIPDYATITEPLRRLTQKHAKFQLLSEHQAAYEKIKNALLTTPVMSYYDIDKQTILAVDASPFGVSAVLGQRRY